MATVKVFADGRTDGQSDYYRAPHFQCGGPNEEYVALCNYDFFGIQIEQKK